jgi:N-methylhydantoinase A
MAADGSIVSPLDKAAFEKDLQALAATGEVEALTICLLNSYVNGTHEREAKAVAEKVFGDIPISISSDVVPEMQEYERTETTVLNSYVRPQVSKYVTNLKSSLEERLGDDVNLAILRSDGGLASARA